MDNNFPSPNEFFKLTKTMLVSTLFRVCQQLEANWSTENKQKWIEFLQSYLITLENHKIHEIQQLNSLSRKLFVKMSYKQFLAIIVPIERQFNKSVFDSDIHIETDDSLDKKQEPIDAVFILDNIRSAFNVGSIFRSAECFGIKKIILCGYTSTPDDPKTLKTTMNTHKYIEWEWQENIRELIHKLKLLDFKIYALETTKNATLLNDFTPQFPAAYIFGNEKFGIDIATLEICDEIVKIPLRGQKNSLNVSVAAGIIAQHISI